MKGAMLMGGERWREPSFALYIPPEARVAWLS